MTIAGKPKRVPRKIKKLMRPIDYAILMEYEYCTWRADITASWGDDKWKYHYKRHCLFLQLDGEE